MKYEIIHDEKSLHDINYKSLCGPIVLRLEDGFNPPIKAINGSLYNLDGTELFRLYIPENTKQVFLDAVNNKLECIGNYGAAFLDLDFFHCGKIRKLAHPVFHKCKIKVLDLSNTTIECFEENTFQMCDFKEIRIPATLKKICRSAFRECTGFKVFDILNAEEIDTYAFGICRDLMEFQINGKTNASNDKFSVVNGILFEKDQKLLRVPPKWGQHGRIKRTTTLDISCKKVLADAFTFCKFKEIILRDTEKIDNYAFSENKNLEHILLPDTLHTISDNAFYKCINLQEITIPASVSVIGSDVFYDCKSLKTIEICGSNTLFTKHIGAYTNVERVIIRQQLSKASEKSILTAICRLSFPVVHLCLPEGYVIRNKAMFQKRIDDKKIIIET